MSSKTVTVTGTGITGSKEVALPSNFDSLSTKAKLDILSGRKAEQDKTKEGLRNILVYGGGSSSGGSSSGGSGSSQQPVVYSSSLLGQSFTSQVAMQQAENQFKQEQAVKAQQAYDKSGGLVGIGSGQSKSYFNQEAIKRAEEASRTKTIADKIKGTGVASVTRDVAIKSLEEQMGRKLNPLERRDYVPIEEERLRNLALTGEQRERAELYGNFLTGATATALAPLVFGVGTVGAAATGLAKVWTGMSVVPPALAQVSDIVNPIGISYEERVGVTTRAQEKVRQRTAQEGLDIPLVNKDVEKLTSAFITSPFGGNIGIGNILLESSGGKIVTVKKQVEEMRNEFIELGYSKEQASDLAGKLAIREVGFKGVGEIVGFRFAQEAFGEITGRVVQKGFLSKFAGGELSKTQARILATTSGVLGGGIGGAAEVAVGAPAFARGRYETMTQQEYLGAIATGSVFAGAAGGFIGFLTPNPNLQKGLYGGLGVVDTTSEFTGDWFADTIVGDRLNVGLNIKDMGKKSVASNVQTFNVLNVFTPTQTQTPTPSKTVDFGFTPSPTPSFSQTQTNGKSLTIIDMVAPTPSVTKTPSKTPTITDTMIWSPTPTPTNTFIDTLNIIETPTDTQTPTDTETPVNTFTQTLTPTQTPTFTWASTITAPFLPLVPPLSFGDGGVGSGRGRSRKKYYNELAAAQAVGQGFNFGIPTGIARPRKGFVPRPLFTPSVAPKTKAKSRTRKDLVMDFESLIFKPNKRRR
jgi:hypothetical protein